jgi:UDP-glucose 4-epimerase
LIPLLAERIRSGQPVTIDGDEGGLVLVPTFVDDIAEVFVAAAERQWTGIINVSAPWPVSVHELAVAIGGILGIEPRFERTGVEAPRVVPELHRLTECYDLARFRPLDAGLPEALR